MNGKSSLNILFLCWTLPHPRVRHSGGMDFYHYIESLVSKGHSVSLLSFAEPGEEESIHLMRELCDQVSVVPYRGTLLHKILRMRWRAIFPKVYANACSQRFRRMLRALTQCQQFDIVHVDGRMASYRGSIYGAKTVLDEVDVFSLTAYYNYQREQRWWRRWYALFEWLRLQAFEVHYAQTYDAVVTRSEKDKNLMRSYLPHQQMMVLPPWFEGLGELRNIPIKRPAGNNLLFMGAMNLAPNIEAVLYFVREVYPVIRNYVPSVRLFVVGASPPSVIQHLEAEGDVIVTGELESLRPFYEICAVNVVPLLVGGGIIVKTLNGMAAGRPTVTTSLGSMGIEGVSGQHFLVADGPESMASAVIDLLTNEALWYRIAQEGRHLIETKYEWGRIVDDLEDMYFSLVNQKRKP